MQSWLLKISSRHIHEKGFTPIWSHDEIALQLLVKNTESGSWHWKHQWHDGDTVLSTAWTLAQDYTCFCMTCCCWRISLFHLHCFSRGAVLPLAMYPNHVGSTWHSQHLALESVRCTSVKPARFYNLLKESYFRCTLKIWVFAKDTGKFIYLPVLRM